MQKLKVLAKGIRDELEGAESYAKKALEYKPTDQSMGNMYRQMAEQELSHADMMHNQAIRLIREQESNGITAPPAMQAVWDWEHENMIEHEAEIKTMLSMY